MVYIQKQSHSKMLIIALLSLASLYSQVANSASYQSGNTLLKKCLSDEPYDRGICKGYLNGLADLLDALQHWNDLPKTFICKPYSVTSDQLADVVVKYLQRFPEKRHLTASSLIINIMQSAFPCDLKVNPTNKLP